MSTKSDPRISRVSFLFYVFFLLQGVAFAAEPEPQDHKAMRSDRVPSIAVVAMPALTHARTNSDVAQESGISSDRKLGWGGGVLFDAPINPHFSVGAGALFINRKFGLGAGNIELERTIPTLFVPVEAKYWLANFFNIGAGAFGSVRVGNVKDELKVGGRTLGSTTSSDHNTLGFGLTASANFLIPVSQRTGFILGARYLFGLTDTTKSSIYDEKIDDLAFNLGVSISI